MYPVTAQYLTALRASNQVVVAVDAWRGGKVVASDLPLDTQNPGTVTVDGSSNVRRQLSCEFVRDGLLWDVLAPTGTELRPRYGVRFVNGKIEWCPLGVFVVDAQSMGFTPNRGVQVDAPDRWVKVQRANFVRPRPSRTSVRQGTEISLLMREAVPEATSVRVETTTRRATPSLVYERSREDVINNLRQSANADAYFDAMGGVVVKDAVARPGSPVWTIDNGGRGVLLDADRQRDRRNTFSAVVVTSTAQDGARFAPVIVRDEDPTSPTYWKGPFGESVFYLDSATLRSRSEATTAGLRKLGELTSLAQQVTGSAVPNPALDAGDAVDVLLPPETTGGQQILERHLVESVTTPLGPGVQSFRFRSSGPGGS